MNEEKQITGGLKTLPYDARDFSFGAIFGLPKLEELPDVYFIPPLAIKDQGNSDMCAAFASISASEDQEGVELSPEYVFMKAKEMEGDYTTWGLSLRDVCKVLTKIGSIEMKDAPFSLATKDRDFLANFSNWPPELDGKAIKHKKASYFAV